MYLIDTTSATYHETLNILVNGKVNLKVDFAVRTHTNTDDTEQLKKSFESITATKQSDGKAHAISGEQLYKTFLQMKAQAVPRELYEKQPDIQTALANSQQLAAEIRAKMAEAAKGTPQVVDDCQIVNYDWPASLTKAQEELASIQLQVTAATAKMEAELKRAEGQLRVEEANKLVELKKAEAIAESIDIIKNKLAGAPEYLMWHQIRVMGEAANGPNNVFILYPYNTDVTQVRAMMGNATLTQMLEAEGQKSVATAKK